MEQFNKMKLVNLKKRLDKFDCEYSARIRAVIDECYAEECEKVDKALRKKKAQYLNGYFNSDEDCQEGYRFQDVICDCGLATKRSYIYEHKKFYCPYIPPRKIEKKIDLVLDKKPKTKILLIEDDDDDALTELLA